MSPMVCTTGFKCEETREMEVVLKQFGYRFSRALTSEVDVVVAANRLTEKYALASKRHMKVVTRKWVDGAQGHLDPCKMDLTETQWKLCSVGCFTWQSVSTTGLEPANTAYLKSIGNVAGINICGTLSANEKLLIIADTLVKPPESNNIDEGGSTDKSLFFDIASDIVMNLTKENPKVAFALRMKIPMMSFTHFLKTQFALDIPHMRAKHLPINKIISPTNRRACVYIAHAQGSTKPEELLGAADKSISPTGRVSPVQRTSAAKGLDVTEDICGVVKDPIFEEAVRLCLAIGVDRVPMYTSQVTHVVVLDEPMAANLMTDLPHSQHLSSRCKSSTVISQKKCGPVFIYIDWLRECQKNQQYADENKFLWQPKVITFTGLTKQKTDHLVSIVKRLGGLHSHNLVLIPRQSKSSDRAVATLATSHLVTSPCVIANSVSNPKIEAYYKMNVSYQAGISCSLVSSSWLEECSLLDQWLPIYPFMLNKTSEGMSQGSQSTCLGKRPARDEYDPKPPDAEMGMLSNHNTEFTGRKSQRVESLTSVLPVGLIQQSTPTAPTKDADNISNNSRELDDCDQVLEDLLSKLEEVPSSRTVSSIGVPGYFMTLSPTDTDGSDRTNSRISTTIPSSNLSGPLHMKMSSVIEASLASNGQSEGSFLMNSLYLPPPPLPNSSSQNGCGGVGKRDSTTTPKNTPVAPPPESQSVCYEHAEFGEFQSTTPRSDSGSISSGKRKYSSASGSDGKGVSSSLLALFNFKGDSGITDRSISLNRSETELKSNVTGSAIVETVTGAMLTTSSADISQHRFFIAKAARDRLPNNIGIILQQVGGSLADSADTCTHYVCPKPTKTETFLCAIAAGKWILTPDYLDQVVVIYQQLVSEGRISTGSGASGDIGAAPSTTCTFKNMLPLEQPYEWNYSMVSGSNSGTAENTSTSSALVGACIKQRTAMKRCYDGWRVVLLCLSNDRVASFTKVLKSGGCENVISRSQPVLSANTDGALHIPSDTTHVLCDENIVDVVPTVRIAIWKGLQEGPRVVVPRKGKPWSSEAAALPLLPSSKPVPYSSRTTPLASKTSSTSFIGVLKMEYMVHALCVDVLEPLKHHLSL